MPEDKDNGFRVEAFRVGDNAMSQSIAMLVWTAFKGGVREKGESMTILVPSGIEMGDDPDKLIEMDEYEIVVRRV